MGVAPVFGNLGKHLVMRASDDVSVAREAILVDPALGLDDVAHLHVEHRDRGRCVLDEDGEPRFALVKRDVGGMLRRHVLAEDHVARERSVFVLQRLDLALQHDLASGLVASDDGGAEALVRRRCRDRGGRDGAGLVRVPKLVDAPSADLVERVSRDAGEGVVHPLDATIHARGDHRVARAFGDPRQPPQRSESGGPPPQDDDDQRRQQRGERGAESRDVQRHAADRPPPLEVVIGAVIEPDDRLDSPIDGLQGRESGDERAPLVRDRRR
jgi:hypothetical protein